MKFATQFFKLLALVLAVLAPAWGYAQSGGTSLDLDASNTNHLKAERQSDRVWQLETLDKDPWIYTTPLTRDIGADNKVLSFEYFCPKGLDHIQVYFGPPISEGNSKLVRRIGLSEGWVGYTIDLSQEMKEWGKTGDWLRLDFGSRPDVTIQIRNLMLRPMTAREKEIAAMREAKKLREAEMEARLKSYLETDYTSEITNRSEERRVGKECI